jgi:hypothetical protein
MNDNINSESSAEAICVTCGTTKQNKETGCCINGHDNWLEEIDDIHLFYNATIKLGVSLKVIMDSFDNNTDIIIPPNNVE